MSVPESYVTCPYNKYHQILSSRLQFHLVKCKKVYAGEIKLIQCPFNSTHLIPEIEMNCHKMYTCPDRKIIESYIVAAQETTPLFPVKHIEVESSENWDDAYHPTYDPMEKCKSQPILIHYQCRPASLKKQLRSEERKRLAELTCLNSNQTIQENTSDQSTSSMRLPQTIPNTYYDLNDINSDRGLNVVPKLFGRGRGRILK